MNADQETFETWNKVAALYEEKFMDLELYNESYNRFLYELNNTKARILDIGCGPGNVSKCLINQHPNLVIEGIDIAPNMVALAQKNIPGGKFWVMDTRQLGEIQSKYDGIVCGFCLPYLRPLDASILIQNCSQLLNSKGLLYLSFVEGPTENSGFKTSSTGDRTFFHYYSLETLIMLLNNAGFGAPMVMQVNYKNQEVHTLLIARMTS